MPSYDAIVLGAGGVGSAALFHLARRGARVLAIDRFAPGHDRGSSHGQTRLIRQAYYEHSDYVPMVRRAFELWEELERHSGLSLYHQIGLVQIGPEAGEVIQGVRASARLHALPIEELSAAECQARFAGLRLPEAYRAIFEERAGYLLVEACVRAHADQAVRLGAQLRIGEAVLGWRVEGTGVVVRTDRGQYSANRLIVAVGAWAGQLLSDLGVPFEVRRKPLYWFAASDTYRADRGCPAFLYDLPRGCFYGVPQIDSLGVKVARHTGGGVVDDPLAVDRGPDAADQRAVSECIAEFLPGVRPQATSQAICMYTMTPDAHFVVDRHPEHPQVVFAAGLSGHGFKFTSVLGETLSELALDGRARLPIEFLSIDRAGLARA
jgi:sarcosine oxidase